ncbi:hypothetical protein G9A89_000664 [Geosiphon pyriformis]|nr:hypothetical protein G9A89_000664 [Geosiphon pyriformis]
MLIKRGSIMKMKLGFPALNNLICEKTTFKIAECIQKKISHLRSYQRWSLDEKKELIAVHKKHGSDWELLAEKYFPSRTSGAIFQQWSQIQKSGAASDEKFNRNTIKSTKKEDRELKSAVEKYLTIQKIDRKAILSKGKFSQKAARDLRKRYYYVNKYQKQGLWTKEEDKELLNLIQQYGQQWQRISHLLQRAPRNISRRYSEYLTHGVQTSRWKAEEFEKLVKAIEEFGPDREKIQKCLPGRSLRRIRQNSRNSPKARNRFKTGIRHLIEAEALIKAIKEHGKNWVNVSKVIVTRIPRKYRLEMPKLKSLKVD